jgi:hypothetical protein
MQSLFDADREDPNPTQREARIACLNFDWVEALEEGARSADVSLSERALYSMMYQQASKRARPYTFNKVAHDALAAHREAVRLPLVRPGSTEGGALLSCYSRLVKEVGAVGEASGLPTDAAKRAGGVARHSSAWCWPSAARGSCCLWCRGRKSAGSRSLTLSQARAAKRRLSMMASDASCSRCSSPREGWREQARLITMLRL